MLQVSHRGGFEYTAAEADIARNAERGIVVENPQHGGHESLRTAPAATPLIRNFPFEKQLTMKIDLQLKT